MSRFCITPEGKIYIFNPDNGSTTPLGKIDAQGRFSWPDGEVAVRKSELERALREKVREEVVAKLLTGVCDGHEWVDLGLPSGLKWATCNVGANSPEQSGSYFAWGETKTKKEYSEASYKLGKWEGDDSRNAFTGSKYVTKSGFCEIDNKSTLEPEDDAATANWGGEWRMPTADEFEELLENCEWEWTEQSGVKGYLGKSKTNNASLFLPIAGIHDSELLFVGSFGFYWSATLFSSDDRAYRLCTGGNTNICSAPRYGGLPIRPVCK